MDRLENYLDGVNNGQLSDNIYNEYDKFGYDDDKLVTYYF